MKNIAVQLYSLRNLKQPLDETLAAVAAIGYNGVELVGTQGVSAAELSDLLNKQGLVACSAHVSMQAINSDLQGVIDFHKSIGNNDIIIPWIGEDMRGSDASTWRSLGAKLNELGQKLADVGMTLHYHNHDFEMRVFDGQTGMEWMLDSADAQNLKWESDIAWIARGGQDIVRMVNKYGSRITRFHAKDNAPVGQGVDEGGFADVGYGTVEWDRVLPAAQNAAVAWYIVEHDLPKDAMKTIQRGHDFLRKS